MVAISVAIVDALNSLLEAEMNSIFRFMGDGSPYLSTATADIRKPLADMVRANDRRAREIAQLINNLGGVPRVASHPGEEVFLAYLSLQFLLPKLMEHKQLELERFENTLTQLVDLPVTVAKTLEAHVAELKAELATLQSAVARRPIKAA